MKLFRKLKIIILLGPPGSGKGTQAELIAQKFNLKYLGSGDTLRTRQKVNDFTGRKLAEILKKGELTPSFIIIKILGDILENLKKGFKIKGFVLDSWTRELLEAILIDEALKWYEWDKNVKVFFINISEKECFDRLTKRRQCKKCNRIIPWIGEFKKLKKCDKCEGELIIRPDDNLEGIKERLKGYRKETLPVINYSIINYPKIKWCAQSKDRNASLV